MRECNSIILHKVIVHVLDKSMDIPLFADYEQEITEEIHVLLEKHIIRSLRSDENRVGSFISGPNIVRDNCDSMLYDESEFIDSSKKIALHLFNSMKAHGNISSCDLVICIYSVDNIKYIAVLKMNYRKSYIHKITIVDEKTKVTIVPQDIGLPGEGQHLQKCAFIRLHESDNEYDFVLLDKQHSDDESEVAQFFLSGFLNGNLIIDNKVKTKSFRNFTEKWVRNQLRQDINSATKARDVLMDHLKKEDKLSIKNFAEEAFENDSLKENFIDSFDQNGFEATEFDIDKEWVDKKLKKKSIKTDTGFEIKNDNEYFDDFLKYSLKDNGDGTVDIIIKNVRNYVEK